MVLMACIGFSFNPCDTDCSVRSADLCADIVPTAITGLIPMLVLGDWAVLDKFSNPLLILSIALDDTIGFAATDGLTMLYMVGVSLKAG
jgi:hypothetical protein